jgi:molybdenum cofactor biosynthesis enzyme MoaA
MFDFANILFAGPCSARCTFCIGQRIAPALNTPNLDLYPPRNLDTFIAMVWEHSIRQVVFSGTNTDPQLYRHEARLLAYLRHVLPTGTQFSLHTNARQALHKMNLFNQYDRACVSLPSVNPLTYQRMMGVPNPPDLAALLRQAKIPVKVSCLVDDRNASEIPAFLAACQEIGVRRLVLRKMYGEPRSWADLLPCKIGWRLCEQVHGNPVFNLAGLEITLWDFSQAETTSINLFADGTLSHHYLLVAAQPEPGRLVAA